MAPKQPVDPVKLVEEKIAVRDEVVIFSKTYRHGVRKTRLNLTVYPRRGAASTRKERGPTRVEEGFASSIIEYLRY